MQLILSRKVNPFMLLCLANVLSIAGKDCSDSIFAESGIAIKGYDPVAYFAQKQAVKGDSSRSFEWAGVCWLFCSDSNRLEFVKNPVNYVPQYGGFCAYGVRFYRKVTADPREFSIVDGRLYINKNSRVRIRWEKRPSLYIFIADRKWRRVKCGERL